MARTVMKIFILFLILSLSACATTAKYESKLNNFIGVSENSLIAAWGVPDKEYRLGNGKKAVEFVSKSTVISGGNPYTVPQTTYQSGTIGGQSYSGTSTQYVVQTDPVQKHRLTCKTSFIIDTQGRVESWQHEGNNCVSR